MENSLPLAPSKPCAFPTCPRIVPLGTRFCLKHERLVQKSYDRKRETAQARGYTHRWQQIRKAKLNRNPLCQNCKKNKKIKPAYLVHHIDENPKNNASDNLLSLCRSCHDEIHSKG